MPPLHPHGVEGYCANYPVVFEHGTSASNRNTGLNLSLDSTRPNDRVMNRFDVNSSGVVAE